MVARSLFATAIAASLAGLASAAPAPSAEIVKRQQNIDNTILQFALTLEHLENVFYKGVLTNFTQQDFVDAGTLASKVASISNSSNNAVVHRLQRRLLQQSSLHCVR